MLDISSQTLSHPDSRIGINMIQRKSNFDMTTGKPAWREENDLSRGRPLNPDKNMIFSRSQTR